MENPKFNKLVRAKKKSGKTWLVKDKGYSSNTLIIKYSSVKKFYEYLDNPLEEVLKLFDVSKHNQRDNCLLKILYYGGLRKSEIVNLKVEDVDIQNGKLSVIRGKGDKDAIINITDDCVESVKSYLEVRQPRNPDEKHLFLNGYGTGISRSFVNQLVKKYASVIGMEKRIYPHLFRISMITHMSNRGCNMEIIRRQSRHADYKTLQGYIQPSAETTRNAYLMGVSLKGDISNQRQDIQQEIPETHQRQDIQTPEKKGMENQIIQLFRDGLIGKDDLMKLLTSQKKKTEANNYIH
jgi:site-specific recombinase XerD